MKQYNFYFEDGSKASLTIEPSKDRHLNMKEEIEGVKAAITSIVRGRRIKQYEVIRI